MSQIKMLTGVVEVGLFCHMAKAAYFGNQVGLFGILLLKSKLMIAHRMVRLQLDGMMAWCNRYLQIMLARFFRLKPCLEVANFKEQRDGVTNLCRV